MGKLRQLGKKIGKGIKSVGKKLKKGFGKIAGAFGKLGPLGSIALSFMLPGIGNFLTGMAGTGGVTGFIGNMAVKISNAAGAVKNGIGKVFSRVTDAIEGGMNAVSKPFMKEGARGAGSAFRDFVSETTNGFVDKSTVGLEDKIIPESSKTFTFKDGTTRTVTTEGSVVTPDMQVGNVKAVKIPQSPKGMTDPVYMDGVDGNLKKGFYESADIDIYNKGVDSTVDIGTGAVSEAVTTGPLTAGQASIKTSGGLDVPKPVKGSFKEQIKNSEAFGTYKKLQPIVSVGTDMNAAEDAAESERLRLAAETSAYFANEAKNMLASKPNNTGVDYFDFNNPNPTETQLYNLQNSYSGILG